MVLLETIALVIRVVLTVQAVLWFASLFGIRSDRLLKYVLIVNTIIQALLNIGLAFMSYRYGIIFYLEIFMYAEPLIWIIETVVYLIGFRILDRGKVRTGKIIGYAFVTNLVASIIIVILGGILEYVILLIQDFL